MYKTIFTQILTKTDEIKKSRKNNCEKVIEDTQGFINECDNFHEFMHKNYLHQFNVNKKMEKIHQYKEIIIDELKIEPRYEQYILSHKIEKMEKIHKNYENYLQFFNNPT